MEWRNAEHDKQVLRVGGAFVAVVAVVGLVVAGYSAVQQSRRAHHRTIERHDVALASVAIKHLTVPSTYVPFTSNCMATYRCYQTDEPSTSVASDLMGIMRTTGAKPDAATPRCMPRTAGVKQKIQQCAITGALDGRTVIVFGGPDAIFPSQASNAAKMNGFLTQSVVGVDFDTVIH